MLGDLDNKVVVVFLYSTYQVTLRFYTSIKYYSLRHLPVTFSNQRRNGWNVAIPLLLDCGAGIALLAPSNAVDTLLITPHWSGWASIFSLWSHAGKISPALNAAASQHSLTPLQTGEALPYCDFHHAKVELPALSIVSTPYTSFSSPAQYVSPCRDHTHTLGVSLLRVQQFNPQLLF